MLGPLARGAAAGDEVLEVGTRERVALGGEVLVNAQVAYSQLSDMSRFGDGPLFVKQDGGFHALGVENVGG